MSIKGLTDQLTNAKMENGARGRPIRIGWLQKGRREGFGKDIKLYDDDHFNFRASDPNGTGQRLEELFKEVYGEKPAAINDVRIPVSLSGNFDIESCAWLTASKHTKNGSVFLGQSDGEMVSRLRDEETGKVIRFSESERPLHDSVSHHPDEYKYGAVQYRGKFYPWQQSMSVDLILTELNEAMFQEGLAGLGVVTLITHSTYDIPTLINEYYAMLNEIVSLMVNPFDQSAIEAARRNIPLRQIPIRLYRSEDPVTTPNWKTKDAGERLNSTRSLLHWQLNQEFSMSAQQAMNKRTEMLLSAVANMPLIQSGRRSLAETNDMLFGDDPNAPEEKAAPAYDAGPDWDELDEALDVEEAEFEDGANEPGQGTPDWWALQAHDAQSLDGLAQAIYHLDKLGAGVFKDANEVKRGLDKLGDINQPDDNGLAMEAMLKYTNSVADGSTKKDAFEAAQERYKKHTA